MTGDHKIYAKIQNMEQADLEKELILIKERNRKVEEDKSWETSVFRKVLIASLTYLVIVLFFIAAGFSKPFINALVPTCGFALSTLSLPWFKNVWLKHFQKRK